MSSFGWEEISGWRIIRKIGVGSFGTVYEVEKEGEFSSGIRSALKVITIPESSSEIEAYRDDGLNDASITALFKSRVEDITTEFRMMNKLKGHSNIVSYEDHIVVQHDSDPGYDILIRMELLMALPKFYEKHFNNRPIDEKVVCELGIDICNALERCSRYNIIHRDIKPQNIFVNEEGDFKLGDFGIAKTSDHTTKATKTGTYGYMAPEVYLSKPYSASVDIYSLGLVLYWMLNERRGPFLPMPPAVPKSSDNTEALERRMHGEPLPAPKHGSEELKRIVLKACAYDPKGRYTTPSEMRRDLERLISASDISETPIITVRQPGMAAIPVESDEPTVSNSRIAEKQKTVSDAPRTGASIQVAGRSSKETDKLPIQGDDKKVGIREIVQPDHFEKEPDQQPKAVPKSKEKVEERSEEKKPVDKSQKNKLLIIAAVVLAVAAVIALISAWNRKENLAQQPTVSNAAAEFTNINFEKAFRNKYGLSGSIHESDILAYTKLDLSGCSLTDISDLAKFKNLTQLNLDNNQISDISALSELKNLTQLRLRNNRIDDLSALSELTLLQVLYLADNHLAEYQLSALRSALPKCRIDTVSNAAAEFTNINFEKAFRNKYGLSGSIHESDILAYTSLDLSGCRLTDISDLAKFTNLTQLNLDNNQISDISALSELKNLTQLNLDNNQISDISALSELKNLTQLRLRNNRIDDLSALSELTLLQVLYLADNHLAEYQLSALRSALPKCRIDYSA